MIKNAEYRDTTRIESMSKLGRYSNIMLSKKLRDVISGMMVRRYQGRQFLHFEEYQPQPDHMKGLIGELPVYELKAFTRLEENLERPPISIYERIASLNKDNLWAHNIVCDDHLSHKRYDELMLAAIRAHDIAPQDEQVLLNLSKAYYYAQDFQQSEQLAIRAIEIDPSFYNGFAWIAKLRGRIGDYRNQLEFLRRELMFCPKSAIVYMNMAAACYELEDFAASKRYHDDAIRLYSEYPNRPEVRAFYEKLAREGKAPRDLWPQGNSL